MSEIKIRLDRSKPFGECRGDRTPEDPHYRVAHFQGQTVNGKIVTLPFDSAGELIPDDGKTESWQGIGPDGKPITYFPARTARAQEGPHGQVRNRGAGERAGEGCRRG